MVCRKQRSFPRSLRPILTAVDVRGGRLIPGDEVALEALHLAQAQAPVRVLPGLGRDQLREIAIDVTERTRLVRVILPGETAVEVGATGVGAEVAGVGAGAVGVGAEVGAGIGTGAGAGAGALGVDDVLVLARRTQNIPRWAAQCQECQEYQEPRKSSFRASRIILGVRDIRKWEEWFR